MLNNEFPPLGGGTASINHQLLKNLDELDVDLVTSALGKKNEESDFSDKIKIYKVPVNNQNIHHSSNVELIKYFTLALLKAFKLNREKNYSLVMAWCGVPAGAMALILKKVKGIPFVVRVSGPDIPGFEERYNNIYPLLKPLLKLIWSNAEAVIVKCKHEEKLISKTKKLDNIIVIPNAVDTKKFKPVKRNSSSKEFNLLCIARLVKRKGQDRIIRSLLKTNEEIILHLVGTGDELQNYKDLVSNLGLEKRVIFHGYIDREKINEHYDNANAFILVSDNEGMTAAGLEAMAAGLPLILSKDSGMNDLYNGENGFLVDKNNDLEITEKIDLLNNERKKTEKMGESSRNYSLKFSWGKVAEEYQSIFKKIKR